MNHRNLNEGRALGRQCRRNASAIDGRTRPSPAPPGKCHMTKTALATNGPLDGLNFLLADVTGGAGPFLAIYLMASQQWSAGRIGIVLTVGGIATVLARGPAGAFVDATVRKRSLIAASALVVGIAADSIEIANAAIKLRAEFERQQKLSFPRPGPREVRPKRKLQREPGARNRSRVSARADARLPGSRIARLARVRDDNLFVSIFAPSYLAMWMTFTPAWCRSATPTPDARSP